MVRSRNNFPKEGEFIVGKVSDIQKQFVYVNLLDYEGLPSDDNARGFIHISEISSRWIKNIRNFLRVGQRIVLRVIRVDLDKGHIDLSYRRTNSAQRENRMKEWKYALKFENLLQFLVELDDIDMTLDEAYNKLGFPVLEFFGDNYQETIEELKENGKVLLEEIKNVPQETKNVFLRIVEENVDISTVSITGKLKLTIPSGDGIEKIKDSLIEAKSVVDNKETRSLNISYIAAPFYRVDIVSKDYLDAENILSEILEVIEQKVEKYNGTYEFIRD